MLKHNLRTGMGYGFSYSFIDFSGGVCEPPHRLQYVEKVKRLSRCAECHLTFLTGAIKSRYAHMCSNGTCAAMAHVQQWHMCSNGTCAAMAHVRVSIPNWCELEV